MMKLHLNDETRVRSDMCVWCFSPPARPGSTTFHPPAPLWPVEAHLSSAVTAQSAAETQRRSAHLNPHLETCVFLQGLKLRVRGVCALTKNKHVDLTVGASGNLSDKTPRSRKGSQKHEWNYWRMPSNIYSLYFALTGTYFTWNCSNNPEQFAVCCACLCTQCAKLTTVEHCFHVKTLRQEQIGLPFEGLRGR